MKGFSLFLKILISTEVSYDLNPLKSSIKDPFSVIYWHNESITKIFLWLSLRSFYRYKLLYLIDSSFINLAFCSISPIVLSILLPSFKITSAIEFRFLKSVSQSLSRNLHSKSTSSSFLLF